MAPAPTIRLNTLGSVSISSASGEDLHAVGAQQRRLALLIYLAVAQPRGFHTRDRVLSLFWPEYDEHRARNALSQAVFFLRRSLGADAIVSGADDQLRINGDVVWCDARAFEEALTERRVGDGVELYRGAFLDGFHVSGAAPELDRWVEGERDRLRRMYDRALRELAEDRTRAGDLAGALVWHRKLAAHDPLSSRAALGLIHALAAAGEPEEAMRHARGHETLLRQELDAPPDPAIAAFVNELRTRPAVSEPEVRSAPRITSKAPAPPSAVVDAIPATTPTAHTNGRRNRTLIAGGALLAASLVVVPIARGRRAEAAPRIECVAVLPITNLSGDSALGFVASALTEAARTELTRYEMPRVISPNSVLALDRSTKSLPEIGRALHDCDGIVEGSLTRMGRVAHVDAQILYAPDDRHLWAQSFETDTSEMLLLERRVSDAIARNVRLLAGKGPAVTVPKRRVDPVAFNLYVSGRSAFRSRNAAALRQAVAFYQQAISLDSTFALAYAGLADAYGFIGSQGYGSTSYLDSARALVARALALDSTVSEAHTSKASILVSDGDWTGADREFNRALELDPNNALAHHWYAMVLAALNRKDSAVYHIRRARELDPMSQPIQGMRLAIEFFAGVKESLGRTGTVKGMVDPTHAGTHAALSVNFARKGRCPEAYKLNTRAQELAPDNTMILISLVGVHLLCREPVRAHTLLTELKRRPDAPLQAVYIASVYAQTNQLDSAFKWLDRSRWGIQSYFELRVSGDLKPIRSDPRYALLLQRLHMPL